MSFTDFDLKIKISERLSSCTHFDFQIKIRKDTVTITTKKNIMVKHTIFKHLLQYFIHTGVLQGFTLWYILFIYLSDNFRPPNKKNNQKNPNNNLFTVYMTENIWLGFYPNDSKLFLQGSDFLKVIKLNTMVLADNVLNFTQAFR